MTTYRTVKNVPDKDWARDVIDRGIDVWGDIITSEDNPADWLNLDMTDGRLWTFIDRALIKQHPVTPPPPPPPDGIVIPPGSPIQSFINAGDPGDTFLLKAGVHGGQTFDPKPDQTFIGEPGAVLDGGGSTQYAVKASSNPPGVTLDGIGFTDYKPGLTRPGSTSGHGMVEIGTGGGWTVQNCEISESTHLGLVFNGPGNKILHNQVHHNRQGNIKGFGRDNLVEGNEISHGNYRDEFPAGGEGGGTKFLKSTNLILRNNWVHHNKNGLWCDFDNDQIVYEDNTVEDNADNGIFQEYGYNVVIRNNTVRRNGRGIKITSTRNCEVHDNTVTDNSWLWASERDRQLSGRHGIYRLRDLNVHDNTVTLTGVRSGIRDNLQGSPLAWDTAANNRFDRNHYTDQSGAAKPFFWENNQDYSWAEWQAAGNDVNGSLV